VSETRRLNGLVLELLDAARAEQGRILGTLDLIDLPTLLRDAAARLSTNRHPVHLSGDAELLVELDPMRVDQVATNLIENAIKYSPEGGPIDVRAWQDGGRAYFSVTDRGIGIPTADLPHVFDRFHRGANVDDRQFAGMGLGLYICRAIVEAHHGEISVVSREGTTFTVRLPLRQPVAAAAAARPAAAVPAAAALPGAGPLRALSR
jgi:signal transduction histidine kinase